jgi:Flp pilus assembly pilin Flp
MSTVWCYDLISTVVAEKLSQMLALFIRLLWDENGAAAIDYGLIALLIAVAAFTVVRATGANLADLYGSSSV